MTKVHPVDYQIKTDSELLLTVSVVTFKPDLMELRSTMRSLVTALSNFVRAEVAITVVDNSPEDTISNLLKFELRDWNYDLISGHGNVGFGRGHNLAMHKLGQFHLVLNPDIQMKPDALKFAVSFLTLNPTCGLISPYAVWPDGTRQYLCKQFPAAFDLLLRGFTPSTVRGAFTKRLSRYEMRNETQDDVYWHPPIVSGCFMVFRGVILRELGGFDPGYFLYFEDFDLTIRCSKIATIAYVPTVEVTHSGGHASRKGAWHIRQFIRSAHRFYMTHGFKLI